MRNVPSLTPFLTIGPTPSIVAITSMERLILVLILLLPSTTIVVTDDRRWRWRPRRRWPIKQVPQVVLQLQVRSGSPRNSLDGQVGSPIACGQWRPGGTSGGRRFVLHVELAEGVHEGAVLVLPAFLQQRLGRNVVQIVWREEGRSGFDGVKD